MDRDLQTLKYKTFEVEGKKVYIFKHHRTALLCWIDAIKNKLINKNSILIHIDRHNDGCFEESKKEYATKLLSKSSSKQETFVQNLSSLNDDFIIPAFYADIISKCISLSVNKDHVCGEKIEGNYSTTTKYILKDKENKEFYPLTANTLQNLFGYQSYFGDSHIHQDTKRLLEEGDSFILDLDLDYFMYEHGDSSFPRHPRDIDLDRCVLKKFFDKSKIITLALEPKCCNDNANSLEILDLLNVGLFNFTIEQLKEISSLLDEDIYS